MERKDESNRVKERKRDVQQCGYNRGNINIKNVREKKTKRRKQKRKNAHNQIKRM